MASPPQAGPSLGLRCRQELQRLFTREKVTCVLRGDLSSRFHQNTHLPPSCCFAFCTPGFERFSRGGRRVRTGTRPPPSFHLMCRLSKIRGGGKKEGKTCKWRRATGAAALTHFVFLLRCRDQAADSSRQQSEQMKFWNGGWRAYVTCVSGGAPRASLNPVRRCPELTCVWLKRVSVLVTFPADRPLWATCTLGERPRGVGLGGVWRSFSQPFFFSSLPFCLLWNLGGPSGPPSINPSPHLHPVAASLQLISGPASCCDNSSYHDTK